MDSHFGKGVEKSEDNSNPFETALSLYQELGSEMIWIAQNYPHENNSTDTQMRRYKKVLF